MTPVLVDTDVLSRFFRNDPVVVRHFNHYVQLHNKINISIITHYEVLSGLLHRDARKQLDRFQEFVIENQVLPLNCEAVEQAAYLYAQTRKQGIPVDDIDILIAGIALAHGMNIATANINHFSKLSGITIENWTLVS